MEGFDVGLEMSGNGMALQQMIGAMRNGGKISLLGISNKPVPMDMNTIITHRYHYTDFQKGFDAMLSGNSGKVVLDWTTKKEG